MLVLAPSAVQAKRSVPQNFFGVVFDGYALTQPLEVQEAHFAQMAFTGVESARVTFPWTALEPRENEVDFSRTDRTVAAAVKHGVDVLPVILYTPYWARANKRKHYSPPRRTSDFTRLMRRLIRRYGSNGSFWRENPGLPRRPIRNWQIWNEPNNDIERYWDAPRKSKYGWPHGYVRLLKAAHKTIHKEDRRARTVLGGITGIAWLEMRRLYKAGARNSFDVAAIQIYPESVRNQILALNRFRAEAVRARDKKVRLWVTEVAFPAAKGKTPPIFNQRQQTDAGMASSLYELYTRLPRGRSRWGLERVYWYTWASRYGQHKSAFDFSGLVQSSDGLERSPQPAYTAYRNAAQRAQGCVKTFYGVCQ